MPVSCVSKDSSCRVSSCVSADGILACGPVFGMITSSSGSSGAGIGEVVVPLLVPPFWHYNAICTVKAKMLET